MSCLRPLCSPQRPTLAYAEAGSGETILLLHGSASTGSLWRRTSAALHSLYRVVVPDLTGCGASPSWPVGKPYSVADEVSGLKALLPCCGEGFHVVGHSFGGLVALQLALDNPVRVRTLTLIEPVFFSALRATGDDEAYREFAAISDRFRRRLGEGDRVGALSEFITFWNGEGAWEALNSVAREAMLAAADKIALDWQAAFAFAPSRTQLKVIAERVTILNGDRSPWPMRRLVAALHELLPGSAHAVITGANHLLPLTHSGEITRFILGRLHADAERQLR